MSVIFVLVCIRKNLNNRNNKKITFSPQIHVGAFAEKLLDFSGAMKMFCILKSSNFSGGKRDLNLEEVCVVPKVCFRYHAQCLAPKVCFRYHAQCLALRRCVANLC